MGSLRGPAGEWTGEAAGVLRGSGLDRRCHVAARFFVSGWEGLRRRGKTEDIAVLVGMGMGMR